MEPPLSPASRPWSGGLRGAALRLWGVLWRVGLYVALTVVLTIVGLGALAALGVTAGGVSLAGTLVSLLAALAAGWVMMRGVEHRPFGAVGFAVGRTAVGETVVGTGIGGALLGMVVLLVAVTGGARWVPDGGTVAEYLEFAAATLGFFAVAAAVEEVLFRGYPFQVLERELGAWTAVVATSLLFGAAHGSNPNVGPLAVANIVLAGALLAVAYLRTRSLWFATAVHLGWNWTMATLLDLPVSGLEWDTPLYTGVETGPDWWTGGSFGPEAGLAATLVLLAGTAWLLRTPRLRASPDVMALHPLSYEAPAAEVPVPDQEPRA